MHRAYMAVRGDRARVRYHAWRLASRPEVTSRSGVTLTVAPQDERAAQLRRHRGALDREAIELWQYLHDELRPTIAIDVGANYGEVAFSFRPDCRELHLFEANPKIASCLRATIQQLPAGWPNVKLHPVAASDSARMTTLWLHEHSGVSSVETRSDEGISVETVRIDETLVVNESDRIAFKIDVEGYERPVLEGMSNLFRVPSIGVCEIEHASADTLSYLCEHFDVSIVDNKRERRLTETELQSVIANPQAGKPRRVRSALLRPRH